jgi:hypothetical protein
MGARGDQPIEDHLVVARGRGGRRDDGRPERCLRVDPGLDAPLDEGCAAGAGVGAEANDDAGVGDLLEVGVANDDGRRSLGGGGGRREEQSGDADQPGPKEGGLLPHDDPL